MLFGGYFFAVHLRKEQKMLPVINVFGKEISMYAVMALIGAAAFCLLSVFLAKKRGKVPAEDIFYMSLYAGIGCLIGAKLLYIIISVHTYWFPEESFSYNLKYWEIILTTGGLVFYGGLIGAVLGALRYCKHFGIHAKEAFETITPAVPLFHAFGRVGCFMAGCCYGIEYDGAFSVTFQNAIGAPNGVPLLPVQLIEAAGNFLLAAVLTVLFLKTTVSLPGIYLVFYSMMRFILEFFRGDTVRGIFGNLSVSHRISMAIFTFGTFLIAKSIILHKKNADFL